MSETNHPLPWGAVPNEHQLRWHRRERYGFIHFTMNTFTDKEWGYGDEDPAMFNPTQLDCRQWVAAAKAGGLKALILTAKHHDGFCLWPTATTTHNISRSPFRDGKGDLVRELSDACREGGIDFGLYCSPWDRNHPAYGTPEYPKVFHAQWKELLSNYGPLCEVWFDGANGGDGFYGGAREKRSIDARTYYGLEELWAECHRLQPQAMIFSDAGPDIRWCGNEAGYGSFTSWCKVDQAGVFPGIVDNYDRLPLGEAQGKVWRPVEVDVSIRPGWFFHPNERPRTGEELFEIWLASVGQNANLLLNLTPDRRGLIPASDVASLHDFYHRVTNFTALDLALGSKVEASGTALGSAQNLVDGNPDTWWMGDAETSTVTIDLGSAQRIKGFRLEEGIAYGQRVEAFSIEVAWWNSWTEIFRGTTIGAQRIVRLPLAAGRRVRLKILSAQAAPVLTTVQLFG